METLGRAKEKRSEPGNFVLVLDGSRGRDCVSRREVLSTDEIVNPEGEVEGKKKSRATSRENGNRVSKKTLGEGEEPQRATLESNPREKGRKVRNAHWRRAVSEGVNKDTGRICV